MHQIMLCHYRYYLHLYEDLLRVIDRSVTIPYWDWTVHSEKPYDSDVFDPILGFGGSSDNVTLCVTSGPFQQREFAMTPSDGGRLYQTYVRRFPFLESAAVVSNPLSPCLVFQRLSLNATTLFPLPDPLFHRRNNVQKFRQRRPRVPPALDPAGSSAGTVAVVR